MSAADAAVPLETLLAHREWVRGLARALTRDENEADDVEQQTWLAAVLSPPRTDASPRGWLGAVARNAARKRGRSAERRRRREACAAQRQVARVGSAAGDPADLAARADLHARVAAAVVALAEPYRQTLLLRYFEGLSIADVSTRMAAPLETTRARLRRGREHLRGRLQRDVGRDRSLAVILLPLLGPGARTNATAAATAVATGGLAMSSKAFIAAAVAALLVSGVWGAGVWWGARPGDTPDVDSAVALPVAGAETETASPETPPAAVTSRRRVRPPPPDDAAPFVPEEETPTDFAERTLAERLEGNIPEISFENEQFDAVLAEISDLTGIPIHIDARAVNAIEDVPIWLKLSDVSVNNALRVLTMISGMRMAVEDERVVVHRSGVEWSSDLETTLIEPKSRDPDRPVHIIIRGRVTDHAGNPPVGAELMHQRRVVGTADSNGEFRLELKKPFFHLTAQIAGAQRSKPQLIRGDVGDEIEMDFVLGPPAGAATIVVTSSSGHTPPRWECAFRWTVPGETRRTLDGDEVPMIGGLKGRSVEGEPVTVEVLPPGEVELTISARGHVRERRIVEIWAGAAAEVTVQLRRADVADRIRDERISFDVQDEQLHRVLAMIRREKALDVVLSGPAAQRLFQHRVSLTVSNDTIENALRAICQACPGNVTWVVSRDVVKIYEPDDA